ncbi:swi snf and rsc complex subunit ssr4 [Moniliophthora roreri MCA 2997]|uniref:Swi snf and rsc complex subunit ssr4 n=1 Tax=Moniliophthora roreri (strain MCA 2997) TaxID=1381753 RepID=V2XDH7_MONRO|nr:swi snf and rsc complex subunit ssr4 [Moniliophthora roreri MCA 2997]
MQAPADPPVLRHPDNFGVHREVNLEAATNMLIRALTMIQNTPFTWTFIDKPPEGQVYLIYLTQPQHGFPNDGIRWQEMETKYVVPVGGGQRELEVHESKFGFIPGADNAAWRLRRRYRLLKGGHPNVYLVHYTRGNNAQIMPSLMNQPVRAYPLRHLTDPPVYVAGEKMGQKVFPPGGGGMPMNFNQQQQMLGQQNNSMEMLERRRQTERQRAGSTARPPMMDEDSGDEGEMLSTKTLAMTRYKRNHDLMNEVFYRAAFGEKNKPLAPAPYKSTFDKAELDERCAQLAAEIETLKQKPKPVKWRPRAASMTMSTENIPV